MNIKADVIKDNFIKLRDILNSQESIAEKIGVLQVELFNNPDKDLEQKLDNLATIVGNAYSSISDIVDDYRMQHHITED